MRIIGKKSALLLTLLLLLAAPLVSRADVLISTAGVGALEGGTQSNPEQAALQDAFSKAALQICLKHVPLGSVRDLVGELPAFLESRGMEDIVRYQITSRSQANGVLLLNVDVRMNDEPLKAWIKGRSFSAPVNLRPRVLLMIADAGSGKKAFEWWSGRGKGTYSAFESSFARELRNSGENVIESPQVSRIPRSDFLKPIDIARSQGADLLLTGTLTTAPAINRCTETSLKVSLVDVRSRVTLSSWSLSHRSDLGAPVMNALLISEIIKPVRALISGKIISHAPASLLKTLCIENIDSQATYQSLVKALKSMESVDRLTVTGVYGSSHSICHSLQIRSSLADIMENLRQKQITDADMLVEDDRAVIRILRQ